MRKKGFTVIELVVSIALTSMIMILLFNMIFSLKDLYINAVLKTELLNKQTIMNQNLNKLLAQKKVKGLYECGENCLRFLFDDKTNTKLEIDKKAKTFSVGGYKTKLVSGSEFGDIKLLTNTIDGVEEDKNDSYLTLEIPVKHSLLSNEEYGINTIYQYDMEAMDIGTVDVVEMAESINELTKLVQSQQQEINSLNTKITSLETNTNNSSTFLKSYPVGSIYISVNNTNPGTTYGGTWEAYGTGRTLVGVDTTQTEFNTVSKTGGEKTHTLTVTEMPSHTHIQNVHNHEIKVASLYSSGTHSHSNGSWNSTNTYVSESPATTNYKAWTSLVISAATATNQYTGGSGAHNNLQPYITVYMWKRTN